MIEIIQFLLSVSYIVPAASMWFPISWENLTKSTQYMLVIAITKVILYLAFEFSLVGFWVSVFLVVITATFLILNSKGMIQP